MIALYNEFQQKVESRHRSFQAAYKAYKKLQRQVKRYNGQNSYMPCSFREVVNGNPGKKLDIWEAWEPNWE